MKKWEIRKRMKEMEEERLEAKKEKRFAYYESCLRDAKNTVVAWEIPDDPSGSLRRKMKRTYDECIDDIMHPGMGKFIRNEDEKSILLFITSIVVPALILMAVLRLGELDATQIAAVAVLLYTVSFTIYFAYQHFWSKNYKKRLKKAAKCRAICDVLEARIYE